MINPFDKDTLPKVLVYNNDKPISFNEKKAFEIVWNIKKVREAAIELAKKNISVYSERDIFDSSFQIAIYQLLPDHSHRMTTFRVSKNFKRVQECNLGSDIWIDIKK